jgi:hypothetical protein
MGRAGEQVMARKKRRLGIRARLQVILKKLDSIEETPVNASKIRAIENKVDDLVRKYKVKL